MSETLTLTAGDGHRFDAYRAAPKGKPRGAVVVIQEIFGANRHIRHVADGYAAAGYVAVAPALFDRVERHVDLGYDQPAMQAGVALRSKIPLEAALADVQAAIDYARQFGKVAVVGYCWGGSLSFLAATRLAGLNCAIGYYGSMIPAHAQEVPKVPTILHFGERDHGIPMTGVEAVKAVRPEVAVHVYDAEHGFNCDERASYDAASAKLALERTLAFIGEHVG